jgi:hypothetical protein
MLGYLVVGEPALAFDNIGTRVPCDLTQHPSFPERHHRTSDHIRLVPSGKDYPKEFRCHHMLFLLTSSRPIAS